MDGITVTVAGPREAPDFLRFVLEEGPTLARAIKGAASSAGSAYSLGREIAVALDGAATLPHFLAGLNGDGMPTDEEIAHEDAMLAEIAARPLTRDEPPPPPEAAIGHEAPEPRRSFAGHQFPRRFDHTLARLLRREGVSVAALAKHFRVGETSISRVSRGITRNGRMAKFPRLYALLQREAGIPVSEIAVNVRATEHAVKAFFDRYDAVAFHEVA